MSVMKEYTSIEKIKRNIMLVRNALSTVTEIKDFSDLSYDSFDGYIIFPDGEGIGYENEIEGLSNSHRYVLYGYLTEQEKRYADIENVNETIAYLTKAGYAIYCGENHEVSSVYLPEIMTESQAKVLNKLERNTSTIGNYKFGFETNEKSIPTEEINSMLGIDSKIKAFNTAV